MSFLADPAFWTAVALLIFVGVLIGAKVPGVVARGLDGRAQAIKTEIEAAQRLRFEAEGLLARHRAQEARAATEAEAITAEARAEAARLGREGRDELAKLIERRRRQAEEKIARAQIEAIADIRAYAARISVGAATRYIRERMDPARAAKLIDGAIAELPARLKGRA
jgi:F-type H+-transporting ATPase subunit b